MEDYGDDSDDNSDEDYLEGGKVSKPWLNKRKGTRQLMSAVDDSEDEDANDDDRRRSVQRIFIEADLTDFRKVTMPRRRLARWCNEPYFEEAVLNFYVRLAI